MSATDELLLEIRERRQYASTEWDEIQEEAKKDRLCVAGKPWHALDPDAVAERRETKRPMLALDELGQYINQTVNDVRANPRGIKFAPTGNGANDKGAEFYQNHMREIEYRSSARVVYSTAFESAVTSSYGWLRIRTKREHIRTFNQDLWIEPIANADQVLPDPNAVWPDSRDMKYLFLIEPWHKNEFRRQFPRAKITNFSGELKALAPQWLQGEMLHVAEYWRVKAFERMLVAYRLQGQQEPVFALVDELPGGKLPAGVENLREERVEDTRVESYLTNGLEILKENKWKGRYIPFVSCFGKILYVDEGSGAKRKLLSMTRLARDPYLLYCYIRTCEAEAIGGVPRSQWVGYEGQFAKPTQWAKANREPVPFLEAKVMVEGAPANEVLPLPTRTPWDPALQGLEISAEAARRAIQAAMGTSPMPTDMQRQNQKSGKFVDKMNASMQKGSFHFVDHYDLMIERTGVISEDLMDKTLDTKRTVPIRQKDDSAATIVINDPSDPQSVFTKGDYRVTVSTGPADASQREAADDFVDAMVSNIATIAELAGPPKAAELLAKSVKLKQLGPIGDEIVELLTPPDVTGKDGKPLPPEVKALLAQVQTLQQQLQAVQQEMQTEAYKEKIKLEGQKELKKMELDFLKLKLDVESHVKLDVAELGAKVERMTALLEAHMRVIEHLHEGLQAEHDRRHELAMAAAGAGQEASMADADRGHETNLAEMAAANQADLAAQQAAAQQAGA